MLILLPDFIGHPSCFRGLLARLGATDCRPVDYHRLDAYASIEALASQVLDGERWCDLIERLDTFPCERPHHLALQDPAVIDFIVHTVSKESVQ